MREFLDSWRDRNWKAMTESCQITWLSNNNDAEQILENWFGTVVLLQYKVKSDKININTAGVMAHIPIIMAIENSFKKVETKYCIGVAVKESGPYQANIDGEWGINPISILRRTNGDFETR